MPEKVGVLPFAGPSTIESQRLFSRVCQEKAGVVRPEEILKDINILLGPQARCGPCTHRLLNNCSVLQPDEYSLTRGGVIQHRRLGRAVEVFHNKLCNTEDRSG